MESLLDHIKQFSNLKPKTLKALGKALKKVELPKGSFLATEGQICQHVYFLEQGCLRGYYHLDGKEVTSWFAFEDSFVTSLFSFTTRKPGIENIQLIEDCVLWVIAYDDLQALYQQHIDMERLGRMIYERYYVMLEERFVANHFKEARERYASLLERSPHILMRVPLGYVASYLGITQETLSRVRGKG